MGIRPPLWTLPNQLTVARLGLACGLFALIAFEQWLASLIVFAVAAFSDWLDGYIARKWDLGTDLGRQLDPLVDKVLNCGVLIALLPEGMKPGQGWLQPWMVIVVVSRELIITGLRSYLETQGAKFGADWLGKIKMVLQCAAIAGVFVALLLPDVTTLGWTRDGLVWATVAVTLLSGLQYLWKAVTVLGSDKTEEKSP